MLTEAVIVAVIAGIPATLAAILSYLSNKQHKPNSGKSMRDSLDQLHTKLDAHIMTTDSRLTVIEEHLTSPTHDRELVGGRTTIARFPHAHK